MGNNLAYSYVFKTKKSLKSIFIFEIILKMVLKMCITKKSWKIYNCNRWHFSAFKTHCATRTSVWIDMPGLTQTF